MSKRSNNRERIRETLGKGEIAFEIKNREQWLIFAVQRFIQIYLCAQVKDLGQNPRNEQ